MSEKMKVDLSKFNLRYETRTPEKKIVMVQRLIDGDYLVYDQETEEVTRLTRKKLRNRYSAVKKQSPQKAA